MRATTLLTVTAVLLTGCAQPEPSPTLEGVDGVGPTIGAEEPAPLVSPSPGAVVDTAPSPSEVPAASPSPQEPGVEDGPPPPSAAPAEEPPPASPPQDPSSERPAPSDVQPEVLLAVSDREGDHGLQGPDWVDLVSVELAEVGEDLRVTLRFAGQVPERPSEEEVPLAGVNIGDEGYQLFIEGGNESGEWAAYLDTPDGFVPYPGTFGIAGRAIVLQVPFNEIGSPTRASVRVFVEWSEDALVLNPTSEDRLDGEPHTFDRNP